MPTKWSNIYWKAILPWEMWWCTRTFSGYATLAPAFANLPRDTRTHIFLHKSSTFLVDWYNIGWDIYVLDCRNKLVTSVDAIAISDIQNLWTTHWLTDRGRCLEMLTLAPSSLVSYKSPDNFQAVESERNLLKLFCRLLRFVLPLHCRHVGYDLGIKVTLVGYDLGVKVIWIGYDLGFEVTWVWYDLGNGIKV